MRARLSHRSFVGLRDVNRVRPGELVGRGLVARLLSLLAIHLEKACHRRDGTQGLAIGVAHARGPADGRAGALRWDPDWRMRLLVGPRPRIDVAELVVLAEKGKRPRLGPRSHDQVVRLGVALLRVSRIDAHGVIFGADAAHETRDQPPAREIVEDRVFLRDHERIVDERQRAAENGELGALDAARERAGENARDRHHAVGGLVMLVEADAVEAELIGKFHLIEILVVELGALLRVVMAVRERDPGRAVVCNRVKIGVAVGHEMEIEEFHAAILIAPMKASSSAAKTSPFSTCGRCPHSGMTTTFAPEISR